MKLPIENWIDENKFAEEVNILFIDSIICYKSGAYRASLLFSYLGFLTILKIRILNAKQPSLIPDHKWEQLLRTIQNEDKWEEGIFDATQKLEKIDQTTKKRVEDPFFSINENLRLQIKYWKDRRNDCAHFKNNQIGAFHIEAFWAFLQSNLPKITVEGGMSSLINKFIKHYDINFTPQNKDVLPLLLEIEYSVEANNMNEFFEKTVNIIDELYIFSPSPRLYDFFEKILLNCSDRIKSFLIEYLKQNELLLLEYLGEYPSRIINLKYSEIEVRNFWKTKIIKHSSCLTIYASLLRNNLIPKSEIDEANEFIIRNIRKYTKNPVAHDTLKSNNFFDSVKKNIFENSEFHKFLWVNERADLIGEIIEYYPPDKDIITILCNVYAQPTNSNWLLERLDKIFTADSLLTKQYKRIIIDHNIDIPPKLEKYFL